MWKIRFNLCTLSRIRQNQDLIDRHLNQFQQIFFMLRQGLAHNLVKTVAHRPSHAPRDKLGSPLGKGTHTKGHNF